MRHAQLMLAPTLLNEIRALFAQLGQQVEVRLAMLGDLSGQDMVSWSGPGAVDTASVAALAAGDLMATLEVGRMLGGRRACNLIVQEHDDLTILVGRVGEGLLLLLATTKDVPLGWSRLAVKRTADKILALVGSAAMVPPPVAVDDDFERSFAAQLDTLW